MHVDWFTVAAQAINFIILMWLLRRFLYHPILNAIKAREKYVADQLADASTKDAAAQKAQADFVQKSEAFDKQKARLLRDAKKVAETDRDRLLSQAKEEADALRSKRKEALVQEMKDTQESIASKIQSEVFAITKKLLRDLADESLEERMVNIFITRLKALNPEDLASLGASKPSQSVQASSAFALSKKNQAALEKAIKETLNTESLTFKIAPDLLTGIELSVEGQKLAWSALDYLETLQGSIQDAA